MRTGRLASILLFTSIFILVSGVLLSQAVYESNLSLNGRHGMSKVVANLKDGAVHDVSGAFTVNDVQKVQLAIGELDITYIADRTDSVTANGRSVESCIIGTNTHYNRFAKMTFLKGGFFGEKPGGNSRNVAVIEERLARKLFNSIDVIGNRLEISGGIFTVTGVFAGDTTLLENLTDNGIPRLIMPAGCYFKLYKNAFINRLEVESPYKNTMGKNSEAVFDALQTAGKDPGLYRITDFNINAAQLRQKPEFIVFLAGLGAILVLLLFLKREFFRIYSGIRTFLQNDYPRNLFKTNGRMLAFFAVKTAASVLSIILIWKLSAFCPYFPQEYVPDDLTDLGYFSELIRKSITEFNLDAGYVASFPELLSNKSMEITDLLFLLNLLPGLLLFYTGAFVAGVSKTPALKAGIISGAALVVSAAAAVAAGAAMGMPVPPFGRTAVVIWIFIFSNVMYFKYTGSKVFRVITALLHEVKLYLITNERKYK